MHFQVLVELIQLASNSKHGAIIAGQLLDVVVRVQAIRGFAVNEMSTLLDTYSITSQSNTMCEVLYAAAWIVGEYSSYLENPDRTLNILLRDNCLPGHIQAVYIQNAMKLATYVMSKAIASDDRETVKATVTLLLERLPVFISSGDIEVQERSSSAYALIQYLKSELDVERQNVDDMMTESETVQPVPNSLVNTIVEEMTELFSGDLNPVAPKAQKKVQLPDGLDIDEWINSPLSDNASSSEDERDFLFVSNQGYDGVVDDKSSPEVTPEDIEHAKKAREMEQSLNPNYLKSSGKKSKKHVEDDDDDEDDIKNIPIAEIALEVPLKVHTKRSDKYIQKEKKASKSKHSSKKTSSSKKHKNKLSYSSSESDYDEIIPVQVSTVVEIPEGATLSDSDNHEIDPDDPHRSLNIDLGMPIESEKSNKVAKKNTSKTELKVSTDEKPTEKKKKHKKKSHGEEKSSKKKTKPVEIDLLDVDNGTEKPTVDDENPTTKTKSSKKKHHHREKKSSKSKKSLKTGYEEFSTPSKEA